MACSKDDVPRHRRSRTDYPAGVVAILDNDGKTLDRYTVVYTPYAVGHGTAVYPLVTMSARPFHIFCQHGEAVGFRPTAGWGTGQRVIAFEDLSGDCQRIVREDTGQHGHVEK